MTKLSNQAFEEGFLKSASPMLIEQSHNRGASEYDSKSQAILESSYNDEKPKAPRAKNQKVDKRVVETGPTFKINTSNLYSGKN